MKTFKSWQSYTQFEIAVKHQSRYIHTAEVNIFFQTILNTDKNRIETFPKDTILWRAQLGHEMKPDNIWFKTPAPYGRERMYPIIGQASEGRSNPKGISYLYLATDRETALAEVRPSLGSYISVGQFKIVRELKIVNCTTEKKGSVIYYSKEPSLKKREEAVWSNINKAFSKAITPTDDVVDYVPTKVLSELFKSKGFDGIGYWSSMGNGYNIAPFNINSAEIINCFLYKVDGIKFDFSDQHIPRYFSKHYKKKKKRKII